MTLPPPYAAPRWLPGGHAQTLWPLLRKGPLPAYRRERWSTPDGDFIDLDWLDENDGRPRSQPLVAALHREARPPWGGPAVGGATPLLVVFHGLEGSSRSHYARALMRAAQRRGWRGVVVHFRGCSGVPNLLPRAYHSGDSAEIDWILRRLRGAMPKTPLFAAGISLGANALLKWLGEQGIAASAVVAAAAGISAPLDLAAANAALAQGFSRIYAWHFLRTLIPAALAKHARFPGSFDAVRAQAARTLYDFDDAVTAPLHGFRDAADYYARASAGPYLPGIAVPTLILNARNDPFLPAAALPAAAAMPAAVTLELTDDGGHVGYVGGTFPGSLAWMPERVLTHFGTLSNM
ncbi:MAG: alpha/beta fold hydrolase [Rhodocyclaceae bacterium]|nr:alpha/beta fold hydrolase [Rhodocyclaceae bacterium]